MVEPVSNWKTDVELSLYVKKLQIAGADCRFKFYESVKLLEDLLNGGLATP